MLIFNHQNIWQLNSSAASTFSQLSEIVSWHISSKNSVQICFGPTQNDGFSPPRSQDASFFESSPSLSWRYSMPLGVLRALAVDSA